MIPVQRGQCGDGVAFLGIAADDPLLPLGLFDVLSALADRQPVLIIHGTGLALAQGDEMLDGGGIAGIFDPAHAIGAQAMLLCDQGLPDPGFVQLVEVVFPDRLGLTGGGHLGKGGPSASAGQPVDIRLEIGRAVLFLNIQHGISLRASGI